MTRPTLELELLVPGLLGPFPELRDAPDRPECPCLARLLGRARRRGGVSDPLAARFAAFGVVESPERDLPAAAVSRLADTGTADDGFWLRADPVHMQAGMDHAILLGSRAAAPTAEEAAELVAAFNSHFAEDGLALEAPVPGRWYLRLDADPGIRTHSQDAVLRRNVKPFLPEGDDAGRWRSLLNEIQMLFFDHPVNRARERRGRLTINSVWFWGGGRLPAVAPPRFDEVLAADAVTRGLARRAGLEPARPPADAETWMADHASGRNLLVLEEAEHGRVDGEPDRWHSAQASIERDWCEPLWQAVRGGELQRLVIDTVQQGRFELTRAATFAFWRRSRPINGFL